MQVDALLHFRRLLLGIRMMCAWRVRWGAAQEKVGNIAFVRESFAEAATWYTRAAGVYASRTQGSDEQSTRDSMAFGQLRSLASLGAALDEAGATDAALRAFSQTFEAAALLGEDAALDRAAQSVMLLTLDRAAGAHVRRGDVNAARDIAQRGVRLFSVLTDPADPEREAADRLGALLN